MKFSEQWLREWVDPPVSTEALAEQLTMAGLEVDSVEPAAPPFDGVIVGRVIEVAPHPDADKLQVCQVDVGTGATLTIVCGAANVHEGMRAPTAQIGSVLPGGLKIKKSKLRGVESRGMLCSARELGLAESSEGLMALPDDAPVGEPVRRYLGLDDAVIDVDLTPNRGDCLGVEGIAREVGALFRVATRIPAMDPVTASIDDVVPVTVDTPAACPRYLGRVVRGADPAAPTPLWMRERLRRSGLRSLGPLVDVTNYVLLELGQPMHAFDLARLQGGVTVRLAARGDRLTLLDGREIQPEADTLLICDGRGPLALAGIMGGADSGVGVGTRDLFLECAFFSPEAIAGRARRYGLQTDSSYRFERGVDPTLQRRALERATALLLDIAGGRAGPITETLSAAELPAAGGIPLRRERLARLLGVSVPPGDCVDILERLGMQVQETEQGWEVEPPPFRFDVRLEVDLIEEIGRVYGYGRIPSHRPGGTLAVAGDSEQRVPLERMRAALVDRGYQEVITYSFVDRREQELLDPDVAPMVLANPLSADLAVMRTSLWPGLVRTAMHNLNRQQERIKIFEYGLTFIPQADNLVQKTKLGGVWAGSRSPEHWALPAADADFYDIKADVEALLQLTGGADEFIFEPALHPALHPGQSARIVRDTITTGWLGVLHPQIQQTLAVDRQLLVFEVDVDDLARAHLPIFAELSKHPSIRRDVSVVVDEDVTAEQLRRCVAGAVPNFLQEMRIFDVYRGKGVDSGRKSVAFGLILQHSSRTLIDQEVDAAIAKVVAELEQTLGAALRE